jgi:hypothetical protein
MMVGSFIVEFVQRTGNVMGGRVRPFITVLFDNEV